MLKKRSALLLLVAMAAMILCLALVPAMDWGINLGGSKLHLLAFGVLAVIGSLGCPGLNPLVLLAGLAGFGGSIELLQGWMAVGREAQLQDWFDDIKAATATITLISLIRLLPIDWRQRLWSRSRPIHG
ncbi:MAG: hypothetical protein KUG65_02570 [Sphingomonadaceae bacterium]|nr:hypothetical protein [Sphingomonadaceae bacterium]